MWFMHVASGMAGSSSSRHAFGFDLRQTLLYQWHRGPLGAPHVISPNGKGSFRSQVIYTKLPCLNLVDLTLVICPCLIQSLHQRALLSLARARSHATSQRVLGGSSPQSYSENGG